MKIRVLAFVFMLSHNLTSASDGNTVHLTSSKEISYFSAPLTKKPLSSWMEVQKGLYPKISPINGKIEIGAPVTILIFFKDPSDKYDISVSDCWAYDNEDYNKTRNKLNLVNNPKGAHEWVKLNYPKGSNLTSLLYSNFTSFKFPDTDRMYLTCNVKLCYYQCDRHKVA